MPIYAILGNHDYHNNPNAQIEYSKQNIDKRWKMPSHDYNVIYPIPGSVGETVQIVFIDTCLLAPSETFETMMGMYAVTEADVNSHLASLETVLASSTATWLLVAGHYPIFSEGEHGDTSALVHRLLPLLRQYRVHAYLNGHDHTLQHISWQGVEFFTSGHGAYSSAQQGPSGNWGDSPSLAREGVRFGSLSLGFGLALATSLSLKMTFYDELGGELYVFALTNPRNASDSAPLVAEIVSGSSHSFWSRGTIWEAFIFVVGMAVGALLSHRATLAALSSCCCCWRRRNFLSATSPGPAKASTSSSSSSFRGGEMELHVYSPMNLREDFPDVAAAADEEEAVDFNKERYI
jgi:hypothetical protein